MTSRLPDIDSTTLDGDAKRVYEAIANGPRGGVRGPFLALIHTPDTAEAVAQLGEIVRYRATLPDRLTKIAVLVTARIYKAGYEWVVHAAAAASAGLDSSIIDAIHSSVEPEFTDPQERLVYRFAHELLDAGRISQATYDEVVAEWGLPVAVELSTLVGYYAMVSMLLNAHEVALPAGSVEPFQ